MPTDADVAEVVAERLTALLESKFRDRDRLKAERSQRFVGLARSLADNAEQSELIAMLLDDYYQQTLHAAPEQPPLRRKLSSKGASGRKTTGSRQRRERRPSRPRR
ncbi:MAG: hypothetical protein CM1200mP25_1070 [Acidobacteriota bacterium]|nr:MAG: hypothetical protein CM1200mP25_1070 [Acidobacteriota bacterium]